MRRMISLVVFTFLVIGAVSASFFVGYRAYREAKRHEKISEEIRLLQEEADRIDQENWKLRDRIGYLQSDSFREREAKRVLEYQVPGEKVIFIRERPSLGEPVTTAEPSEKNSSVLGSSDDREPNYQKWWNMFFGR